MTAPRYPFDYDPTQPIIPQVSDWVSDVFYDILPEAGFEVRDEQIYMAYQLERAFAEKQTMFAEAGVGTGKTLVYLLYSICYARYMRKPVVVACADESLIEQLVKPAGDIAKIARHLNMEIDARLAKSPDQYVCLKKLDEARFGDNDASDRYQDLYEGLPSFVHSREALQSFYAYGDRKHYPELGDPEWSKINWDAFQDCLVCDMRHRCGQTLSREHYRRSADLIICSHDFYMEHVWTYEARKREGQLPLLPEHCGVVFDEGHLLESAAQKALTYRIKHTVFEELMTRLLQGEVRESFAELVEEIINQSIQMFHVLEKSSKEVAGSDRKRIEIDEALLKEISQLRRLLSALEEELVFESGLFTLNEYQQRIVEEHIEMMQKALQLFDQPGKVICWAVDSETELTLAVMPRAVKEVLRERVFAQKMPIIFSSATLSVDGSFQYAAQSLGVESFLSFSVASPYDYEHKMEVIAPAVTASGAFEDKLQAAAALLKRTEGRALILFPAKEELMRFKQEIQSCEIAASLRFLFEGEQEISHLIDAFQQDEHSVLGAVRLWEGLDIPGPSLSNVIIWSLPYPPEDPVFQAKRSDAVVSSFEEVDLPYMLLRLRQGMGRLIRSREDEGMVALLSKELHTSPAVRARIEAVLPKGVKLKDELFPAPEKASTV